MRKEVSLCDTCDKQVSVRKCDICNHDMCEEHTAGVHNVVIGGKKFGTLYFCLQCKKKFWKVKRKNFIGNDQEEGEGFYDDVFQEKIFKEIKQYVKNRIIAEEL